MRFTVESWAPEYGTAVDADQLAEPSDAVDVGVEVAAGEWAPVGAPPASTPGGVVFVDGIRRIDARVWITDGDRVRAGVCASVAAGAVRCGEGPAEVVCHKVLRGLFAAAAPGVGPIVTSQATYGFAPCAGDAPDDLYLAIHEQMTALERLVGESDAAADAELVVFDGPLRGRADPRGVGLVKTQHVQYLPDAQQRVLGLLGPGDRTPLFLIGGRGFTRWSWYQRLPGPVSQPLSGIVRCELPALGTATEAIARAGQVASMLPRYASEQHKDARAPQNLYPIAGLERDLRRRLGDQALLERLLRRAAG